MRNVNLKALSEVPKTSFDHKDPGIEYLYNLP